MSNNKIMTAQEWCKVKYGTNADELPTGATIIESYAEYYHAEQMKQGSNDAEQAALKEYPSVDESNQPTWVDLANVQYRIVEKRKAFIRGWQSKPSDAVEFAEWCMSNDIPEGATPQQLYSQFQNRDK